MSAIDQVVNEVFDSLYSDDPELQGSIVRIRGFDNVLAMHVDGEMWFIGVGRAVSPAGDVLREVP